MALAIVPFLQDKACSTVQTVRLGKIVKTRGECQKAEVNRISPFLCQAGEVCTNTSLRDREERRAL